MDSLKISENDHVLQMPEYLKFTHREDTDALEKEG